MARQHALDMASHHYFDDVDLSGRSSADRVKVEGYREQSIAENIAYGPLSSEDPTAGWPSNPGHCETLIGPRFKLCGGVAVIKVGAATEIEMKEKKARVEDALHATRAAVEEGVVPGGGVALIRVQRALEKLEGANKDQTVGIAILRCDSLSCPTD